ncbi:hypothetical protein R6Z02_10380, partial [Carnobacterium maltaromaticum]|uniref:hypothetical protein n=2 Tax=Carnobacterium TaxID=2747 RepID=UPI00298ACBE7
LCRDFIFFPKSWLIRAGLDKKLVETGNSGRKIGKYMQSIFLLCRDFIFFPKSWLIRAGLDKKLVETGSSQEKSALKNN